VLDATGGVRRACRLFGAHLCLGSPTSGRRQPAGAPWRQRLCAQHHALWGGPWAGASLGGCQGRREIEVAAAKITVQGAQLPESVLKLTNG
jgi:hypothetical protein